MQKENTSTIILIILILVGIIGLVAWLRLSPDFLNRQPVEPVIEEPASVFEDEQGMELDSETEMSDEASQDAEQAELVGFQFILDFIEVAPPIMDEAATDRAYQALSSNAQQEVSLETASRDLALFVGVQDVPDQGVSVENLVMEDDGSATLTVGLNFSGGRVLREITLIKEDGEWKVDAIVPVDEVE